MELHSRTSKNEPRPPPEAGLYGLRIHIQEPRAEFLPSQYTVPSLVRKLRFTLGRCPQTHEEHATKDKIDVLLCSAIVHGSMYSSRSMILTIIICQLNAVGIILEAKFAFFHYAILCFNIPS